MTEQFNFSYEVYNNIDELNKDDRKLLERARSTTVNAYVPYSNFQVGAAAELDNGSVMEGTNQENASFPVGVCAERVLLGAASAVHPGVGLKTMAISYNNLNGKSDRPVSPCGMCRQALAEYEERAQHDIRIILSGKEGKIYIINKVKDLLPLGFNGTDLN